MTSISVRTRSGRPSYCAWVSVSEPGSAAWCQRVERHSLVGDGLRYRVVGQELVTSSGVVCEDGTA
jgi:hypothetical protein